MVKKFFFMLVFLCVGNSICFSQIEVYEARKEAERMRPNAFLDIQGLEKTDLLRKYYESIFLEQGKAAQKFGLGAALTQEELLQQYKLGVALEGAIDPQKYIVGPSDAIAINLWGQIPLNFFTIVTPEGTLIVPTVGEIRVARLSLKEAKERVIQEVRKKYSKGDITVTLISPRTFLVKVAGVVNSPGAYRASSVDRVDKVIYLANLAQTQGKEITPSTVTATSISSEVGVASSEKSKYFRDEELPAKYKPSMRNIKLVRSTGDTVEVDLIRYYATGDAKYNPYLLDGDIVIVPSEKSSANRVSIFGAVRLPGQFEYHEGDNLSTMFKITNGPTEVADLEHVELVRFEPDGKTMKRTTIDVHNILAGKEDIPLQRNDRVMVRAKRDIREEFNVDIMGEVKYPGRYAITRFDTKLSEIIKLAGGFTENAAIAECKIIRKDQSSDPLMLNPDYERLAEMRLSGMNKEEREYFNYEAAIKRGFVSVDFKKLFIDKDPSADVTLRGEDLIIVPSNQKTVYVYGQVANPGYQPFVDAMNYKYYIERAGGYSEAAAEGDVAVIKAGTKQWGSAKGAKIEVGDAIFVPRKLDRGFVYYFTIFRDVFSIAAGVATVALLYIQVRK